jgi:hypothetical protein
MAYFCQKAKKSLNEIMESDAVSDFHKYPFYHELPSRNINPVIMDTLISNNKETGLPPDVVGRQPGRPQTKRLCSWSKCDKPEHSTIICIICNDRGHNKRTCLACKNATTTIEATISATDDTLPLERAFDNITLPHTDLP